VVSSPELQALVVIARCKSIFEGSTLFRCSSLKRFPVLAFEASDADLIAENLHSVIKSCRNDK